MKALTKKQLIVLSEPKNGGARPTLFPALGAGRVPPPHFQIGSGATVCYVLVHVVHMQKDI